MPVITFLLFDCKSAYKKNKIAANSFAKKLITCIFHRFSICKMTNTSEMASFLECCWGKLKHILIKWMRSFWDTRRYINFCIFSYSKYTGVSLNWNLTAVLIEPVSSRLLSDKYNLFFVIFCRGFLRNIAF